jgi:hypothetical protein
MVQFKKSIYHQDAKDAKISPGLLIADQNLRGLRDLAVQQLL